MGATTRKRTMTADIVQQLAALDPVFASTAHPLPWCRELARGSAGSSWIVQGTRCVWVLKSTRDLDWLAQVERISRLQNGVAAMGLAPRLHFVAAGQLWARHYLPGRVWTSADLETSANVARLLGVLRSLHRCPIPSEWHTDASLVFDMQRDVAARWQRVSPLLASDRRLQLCDRVQELGKLLTKVSVSRRAPALLHLDVHAGNIIENDGLTLIDWEYAALGDPLWDLAQLCVAQPQLSGNPQQWLQWLGLERGTDVDEWRAACEAYRLLNDLWYCEREQQVSGHVEIKPIP
jgi:thiamine kinase-like enzyme